MQVVLIEQSDIFAEGICNLLPLNERVKGKDLIRLRSVEDAFLHMSGQEKPELVIIGHVVHGDQSFCDIVKQLVVPKRKYYVLIIPEYIHGKDCKVLYQQKLIDGALLRNCSKQQFYESIETILQGDVYLSPEINMHLSYNESAKTSKKDHPLYLIQRLTTREREILDLVIEGKSSTEISKSIYIATHTVKTHRKNILKKLGVNNSRELMQYMDSLSDT